MQMSVPTLTGISGMKINRKIPGMKESSKSIQLFTFKMQFYYKTVTRERFLHILKLGNKIYTPIIYCNYCHNLLSLRENISSWSIKLSICMQEKFSPAYEKMGREILDAHRWGTEHRYICKLALKRVREWRSLTDVQSWSRWLEATEEKAFPPKCKDSGHSPGAKQRESDEIHESGNRNSAENFKNKVGIS